jgi:hypothetical protein
MTAKGLVEMGAVMMKSPNPAFEATCAKSRAGASTSRYA